ncbi:MAG: phosphate ABC transporter permease PstA [Armatimonadota bacterium]|nr:phosphate ABC transporter permease PstA [Armatimonadota bacterium]MDR7426701.1 phosphate ABC transporter permease PstA [Armatimonadota bacterium]MDR7465456.1 phosphate ABC transporter permease PstA [Armatimonadota bacterium]MDR7469252.1 phosphate ABC transporter permease PstA [Armatimonadota bacterium]MDR7538965.1 phosphate ABC transporter permease PstA [Armatimonadota bacterium]
MAALAALCAALVLAPLFLILVFLTRAGLGAVNLEFFTSLPGPAGERGGGMANAIAGTVYLLSLAAVLGVPLGVLGGVFLAEYPHIRLTHLARFAADVLNGTPSIIMGLFAYILLVLPLGHFSALAGGVALGVMLIPIVLRTTEEVVRLVPSSVREASLALGIPQWRTTLQVVLPTAAAGIITGIMVGLARIAGETAPLLFTAFGNRFWNWDPLKPMAALPIQIFAYAISPFDDWHRQAWAGALVLVTMVLLVNVAARTAAGRQLRLR